MGKEIKNTPSGTTYFEVSLEEMISKLNGLGICDSCATPIKNGFLVPVLKYVQCETCFKDSGIQNIYYEEDRNYEKEQTAIFKEALER